MLHNSRIILSACVMVLGMTMPAAGQSTLTLESFDLGPRPDAPRPNSAVARCLVDQLDCDPEMRSQRRFTLNDVINLGIVNRQEVVRETETAAAQAARQTMPLPSVDLEVLFDYASYELRGDQLGPLLSLASDLQDLDFSDRQLILMGHTDAVGSAAFNIPLSMRRAEAVAAFLSSQARIPRHRIKTAGMGFEYLRYPHDPTHAANRRVQIMMISQ
ncbi:MAG: OmpA family protein [Natronohydrobacter sp.]|nr:OmpA family protein [Natronohydrobacter sp.]